MAVAIDIAPREASDVEELFGLAKSTFSGMPGWSDGRVLAALADDVVFVAREHGQCAGYVALRREAGDGLLVEQLFVAPGHERRGVGRRLLAYAEGYAIAERAPALRAVVEGDNGPARRLFGRSGFVQVEAELFELVLPRLA